MSKLNYEDLQHYYSCQIKNRGHYVDNCEFKRKAERIRLGLRPAGFNKENTFGDLSVFRIDNSVGLAVDYRPSEGENQ